MEPILSNIIPFSRGNTLAAVSSSWREQIQGNDQAILEGAYRKYPSRKDLGGDIIPIHSIYDLIRAAIDANDVGTVRKFVLEFSEYIPIHRRYLIPHIQSIEMLQAIYPKLTGHGRVEANDLLHDYEEYIGSKDKGVNDFPLMHPNLHLLKNIQNYKQGNDKIQNWISFTLLDPGYGGEYDMELARNIPYILDVLLSKGYLDAYPVLKAIALDDPILFGKHVEARGDGSYQYVYEGDIILLTPEDGLGALVIDADAIDIFTKYIPEGLYLMPQGMNIPHGKILKYLSENEEALDSIFKRIESFTYSDKRNVPWYIDILDYMLANKIRYDRALKDAAMYSYVEILDKYITRENVLTIAIMSALYYKGDTRIDPLVYGLIHKVGLDPGYIAFYLERERPYQANQIGGRKKMLLFGPIPKDMEVSSEGYSRFLVDVDKYQKWRKEYNADRIPPPSFWPKLLATVLALDDNDQIAPLILRFHGKDITPEILKRNIKLWRTRYIGLIPELTFLLASVTPTY